MRRHRKSERMNLFRRHPGLSHGLRAVLVGHDEAVAVAAIPNGIDRDRIGYDGVKSEWPLARMRIQLLDQVSVNGIHGDDTDGARCRKKLGQGIAQSSQRWQRKLHERNAINEPKRESPNLRRAIDQFQIGAPGALVKVATGYC